ncbi:MAG TPA: serine hydrolase domain-containing protein [Pyrinomonadaceae bacterium]|nr:serine hydrolase domain-containing protein [Pyrinomonadaceae bacterium]
MKYLAKNRRFPLLVSFVVVALLVGARAYAQDKTGEIDRVFGWATPSTPGSAVAVSQRGKLVVNRAYGSADLERDVPLSPNSILDIGSVRKQFVAAADLQAFAGRYESDEVGSVFKVVAGQGSLMFHREGSGGKGSELKPVYRDTFQIGPVTIRFVRDSAGKVSAFDYSNPLIRNFRFTRVSER